MPKTVENPQSTRRCGERTEVKVLEDVNKIIAEANQLGTECDSPNTIANIINVKVNRDAALY